MRTDTDNLFELPDELPSDDEFLEVLAAGEGLRIERIISHGHTTPKGQWYDQKTDEWVLLLQGEATLEWGDGEVTRLEAGDAVFIAAHRRHRVASTTSDPPCIWLAVHGKMKPTGAGL